MFDDLWSELKQFHNLIQPGNRKTELLGERPSTQLRESKELLTAYLRQSEAVLDCPGLGPSDFGASCVMGFQGQELLLPLRSVQLAE